MLKAAGGALLYLLLAAPSAQTQKIVAFAPGPCCRDVWVDGKHFFLIQDENVTVAVGAPLNFSARLHAVEVQVRQNGATPVDVNPALFSAFAMDNEKTPLPYLDYGARVEHDRKHRSIVSGILNGVAAAGAGASASQPQTATVNNSNGTASTITYTDPNAAREANEASAAKSAADQRAINSRAAESASGLLTHNTLSRGQSVVGLVYFEGPKGMKPIKKGFTPMGGVNIVLNGTTYSFQAFTAGKPVTQQQAKIESCNPQEQTPADKPQFIVFAPEAIKYKAGRGQMNVKVFEQTILLCLLGPNSQISMRLRPP